MALFKSLKRNGKKAYGSNNGDKEVKFVYLSSSKAVFLINGEVRESKYSFGVPIIPLYGKYRSAKEKKVYKADELKGYNVILNIPKDADIDELKGKRLIIIGFDESEVLVENEEEKGGEG
jgi:hypothetical protein